jgi:hypothetical protein
MAVRVTITKLPARYSAIGCSMKGSAFVQSPWEEVGYTGRVMRDADAVRVTARFGESDRLDRVGDGLGESAEVGEALDQPVAVVDRDRRNVPEEVAHPVGGQSREILGGERDDLLVVAAPEMRLLEIVRGDDAEPQISLALGDPQCAPADHQRLARGVGRLVARHERIAQVCIRIRLTRQ